MSTGQVRRFRKQASHNPRREPSAHNTWALVPGVRCLVLGTWYFALRPDTRYRVLSSDESPLVTCSLILVTSPDAPAGLAGCESRPLDFRLARTRRRTGARVAGASNDRDVLRRFGAVTLCNDSRPAVQLHPD